MVLQDLIEIYHCILRIIYWIIRHTPLLYSNQERLEYLQKLLQDGQVSDFNNLRNKDNQPIYLPNIDLSDKNLLGIDLMKLFFQNLFLKEQK